LFFLSLGLRERILSSFSLEAAPFPSIFFHQSFQVHEIGDQAWIIEASWIRNIKKKRSNMIEELEARV
jgi:hypothetical protein